MREIKHHVIEGKNHNEAVLALDEPGPGGACHVYRLHGGDYNGQFGLDPGFHINELRFQKGGIQEAGINGVSNEQVLTVLIDRLEGFMSGPFPTPETQEALDHCRAAMEALHRRTRERLAREVEGKSVA